MIAVRTRVVRVDAVRPDPEAIQRAAGLLRRGGLVAFPTETVYGLGANLEDPQAIQELYQVKARPFDKQVTIHVSGCEEIERHGVELTERARWWMERFWPGPLTLVLGRPDGSTVGFRMPNHPVALALLRSVRVPVVAPSANRSGRPAPRTAEEVMKELADRIDLVLDAGPTPMGVDSTVVDLSAEPPRILRRGAMADEVERALKRHPEAQNGPKDLGWKARFFGLRPQNDG